MKNVFKSIPSALVGASLLATSFTGLTAGAANAQDLLSETDAQRTERCAKKKPHKAKYSMTTRFWRKYEKTEEMVAEKRWADADRVLQNLLNDSKTNPYEKTLIWQTYANIAIEQNDQGGAIKAIENILGFEDALREKQQAQMMLNLAQLYYSEEQSDKALKLLAQWEPKAYNACSLVSAGQIAFLGVVHHGQENYDKSLQYMYAAIKKAELDPGIEPSENWYMVAMAAHWERKEFPQARDVLEILVFNYPKRSYWLQMTQAYIEMGDEKTAYAILTSLYQSGMLDDNPSQLSNVAQIFLSEDTPIRAAWVLEKADGADQLDEKKEAQNMSLLGGAYINAREPAKALPYMIRSAKASEDARNWFQIGQIQYSLDNMEEALEAFEAALEHAEGNDERTKRLRYSVHMQRGNVLTVLERFKDARKALDDARKYASKNSERSQIQGWRRYIASEEARVKMLTGR